MKKYLLILFILLNVKGFSQYTKPINIPQFDLHKLHFGFTIGLNTMDFTVHNSARFFELDSIYSVEVQPQLGFNLGIVSDLKLTENINFRFLPGLMFGQRNMEYLVLKDSSYYTKVMKIESTFLDFPLVFKYRALRYNNYRPYLLAGVSFKIDLASQKEIKEEEKPKIRLRRLDGYYEVGFGIDYYLPFFKLSTELKFAVGVLNMMKPDDTQYSSAVESMNSKMLVLSFHFE